MVPEQKSGDHYSHKGQVKWREMQYCLNKGTYFRVVSPERNLRSCTQLKKL